VDFVGSGFNGPTSLADHDHEGHSGWRIDQLDANIVTWLRNTTPRTVLLHIGTNDVIQNIDLPNTPNRLSALIDKIIATVPQAEVFVATIIPLTLAADSGAKVQQFNAAIPGIVQAKGPRVHLVDMFSKLTGADLADQIHPTASGYSKMATAWYDALRSVPGGLTPPTSTSAPVTTRAPSTAPPTTTRMPSTAPPTTTRPTTAAPTTGGRTCSAAYTVVNQWPGGYQGSVRVTAGGAAISGWTVRWTFASGQAITQSWNTTLTASGSAVTARNVSYNGSVDAGASTEFGFLGSGAASPVPAVTCTAT
jgi:hypothetical protein